MKNYLTPQEKRKINTSLKKQGYKTNTTPRNKKGQFIKKGTMFRTWITCVAITIICSVYPAVWDALAETSYYEAEPLQFIIEAYKGHANPDKNYLVDKVIRTAKKYNVDHELMIKLIDCEAGKDWQTDIQSYHKYKNDSVKWGVKKGDREESYGLAQIHLPDHPTVAYEQAIDPDFAIEFMAKNISEGRASMWTCYKLIK